VQQRGMALNRFVIVLLHQTARHLARYIGSYVVTVWAPQTGNCPISQWVRFLVW
jgi:hypothetical protein